MPRPLPSLAKIANTSTVSASVPAHRIAALDGLRAISIVFVIFSHVIATNHLRIPRPLYKVPWGLVGVEIFFVLSGFLITWLLLKEKALRGRVSLEAFYLRRAVRILPPAILYLAAAAVLTVVGVYHVRPGDFAACIFFVRNLYNDPPFAYQYYSDQTSHYWSLSVEEQFYLVWPLLLLVGGSRIAKRTGWWVLVLPVCAIYVNKHILKHPLITFVSYFSEFAPILSGCLLALYRDGNSRIRDMLSEIGQCGWIPAVAALGALLINYIPHAELFVPLGRSIAFVLIINSLIEVPSSLLGRTFNLASVSYLGRLSYSLYLWQQIFCWADPKLPRRWWEEFPLNVTLACMAALLSYHLVELPAFRLRAHLMKPRSQSAMSDPVER